MHQVFEELEESKGAERHCGSGLAVIKHQASKVGLVT